MVLIELLMVCLLATCEGKNIDTKPEKHLQIEVGQAYNQNIPLLFKRFQHTNLTYLKRQVPFHELPICEIRPADPALLRQTSFLPHNTSQQQTKKQQMIYNFEDLTARKIFIDAIEYKSLLVALYHPSQVIFYSLLLTGGLLEFRQAVVIEGRTINDGKFVINQDHILLFTINQVIKINQNGTYQTVKGFVGNGKNFDDVMSIGQFIYIAAGNEGIYIYTYDPASQTLKKVSNSTFYDIIGNNTVPFDANKLHIDPSSGLVYVLDREVGVISASLEKVIAGGRVKAHELKVLMGGCENMAVTPYSIFLTCPQLVELNRQTGGIQQVTHNTFYVYEMIFAEERLFLYGHQEAAVYDIFGNIVQEHTLGGIVEKSFLLGDYLVSFSDWGVSSSLVIPQQERLHCYTGRQDRVGTYQGKYTSMGLCREYFYAPQDNNHICQVSYPFILKVANSAFVDYKMEIILVGSCLIVFTIIAIVLAVRNHCLHKTYRELVQQETRENIEMAVQSHPQQKQRHQEVVE